MMTWLRVGFITTIAVTALNLLPFRFASAGAIQTLAPVVNADGRLGLCDVLPGDAPASSGQAWAQLAYNAGARVNRWEFRWDRLERNPGQWDFSADDAAVQSSLQHGLEVLGILIGTPGWAAAPGNHAGNGVPRGMNFGADDPRDLWTEYVRHTVMHYKGQVRYWEIWNEPDLRYFWTGNAADYFGMLRLAYGVIRQTDPTAQVLLAGMVVPDLSFLTEVLDAARSDPRSQQYHGYFDAAAWHAYAPARDLYTNVVRIKTLLSREGFGQTPVWVTEDGFPASNPNGEVRQAASVTETIAYALAAGADHVLIYRESDDTTTTKSWGLLDGEGDPRLGYISFQLAARYFAHARAVVYAPTPVLERVEFYLPNQRLTLVWTKGLTNQIADIAGDNSQATIIDPLGMQTPAMAQSGHLQVAISGASYNKDVDPTGTVVGGPAVMVAQANMPLPAPTSTLYVLPVPGQQRRFVEINPSNAPTTVQVRATGRPAERIVLQLAPHGVVPIDLDLLAGPDYIGTYDVSSTGPIVGEASSDRATIRASLPTSAWYMPLAPQAVTVLNPSATPVTAQIVAFGTKGVMRVRARLQLAPGIRQEWRALAAMQSQHFSLSVHATAPVVLGGAAAVPQASSTWYAIQPRGSALSIFNPNGKMAVRIDARFLGGRTVIREKLRVAAHHSVTLGTHGAKMAILSATHPIAVAYRAPDRAVSLVPSPAQDVTLPLSQSVGQLTVFNPAAGAAHVRVTTEIGTATKQMSMTLKPLQLRTVMVRGSNGGLAAVAVHSDSAIVAATGS